MTSPEAFSQNYGRLSGRLGAALRWAGLAVLAALVVVVVIAFALAAAVAALIGLVVGGLSVLVLRLASSGRRRRSRVSLLEGRRTPDGWVVEGTH